MCITQDELEQLDQSLVQEQGNVRGRKTNGLLNAVSTQKVTIFNPNTKKLCFSHCLVLWNVVNPTSGAPNINTYKMITKQANDIAELLGIKDGCEFERCVEICEE